MNKTKSFFKKMPNVFKSVSNIFHARSMSTQLIITIVLLFSSFFILQSVLNSQFFAKFYTQQEFNNIHTDLIDYVDSMNEEDADYYDLADWSPSPNNELLAVSEDFIGRRKYSITFRENKSGKYLADKIEETSGNNYNHGC